MLSLAADLDLVADQESVETAHRDQGIVDGVVDRTLTVDHVHGRRHQRAADDSGHDHLLVAIIDPLQRKLAEVWDSLPPPPTHVCRMRE